MRDNYPSKNDAIKTDVLQAKANRILVEYVLTQWWDKVRNSMRDHVKDRRRTRRTKVS